MKLLHTLVTVLAAAAGMGTIDRAPMRISAPHRPFLGYTVVGTRSAGPAPIPFRVFNQRQKRKRARQMA